ncbi:MAG: hypothetical protein Q8Q09_06300 [Deltaproteobacteria bacterium]|nr:hypothetical protein [Deltaproteobacteria bacterium]
MSKPLLFSLALLAAACGASATHPDASTDSGPDSGPACAFELVPPSALDVGQGAPLRFGVTSSQGRTALEVRSAPEGAWGAADAPFDAVTVRAPYSVSGAVTVTVEATCDNGGRAQRTATLNVRAMQWQALPAWMPGTTGPIGREYGAMWVDQTQPDRMLMYGGFVYEPQQFTPSNEWWEYSLTGNTWTPLMPAMASPGLPGGRFAQGPAGAQGLFFGGLSGRSTPSATHRVSYARDSLAWEAQDTARTRPSGDYQPGLVYDAARARYVSFCGAGARGYHCGVWLFDPMTQRWTESNDLETDPLPAGRNGFAFVHDVPSQRVVMFSGERGGSGSNTCDCAEDTWSLDLTQTPPRWALLTPTGTTPPPRRNSGFAYDSDTHRMLVWGGTSDGRNSVPGLWLLSLDRGHERWSRVDVPNGPRLRSSSMIVYDSARKRFVAGFGNGPNPFTDLWALSL